MLIQAEAGVASVTGGPEAPSRVGVSVCDIASGMNAYEAILEALIARGRTGEGAAISVSMFDAHGRLDDGAAPAARGRLAAQAHRPRPHLDLALRRVQVEGRRRHSDLDPERPRMADPCREGAGRQGARRRSGFRHQHRAGEAPRRDRRQGRRGIRQARRRRRWNRSWPMPTSPSAASTARPSWRSIRICAASRSARPTARCPIRRPPRNATASRGAMGRCRRWASTARKCVPSSRPKLLRFEQQEFPGGLEWKSDSSASATWAAR